MRITESQLRRIVKRIVEDSTFIQPGQHAQELGLKVPEEDIDILQSAIDSGAYNGEEFNVDAYPERWTASKFKGRKDLCSLSHDTDNDEWFGCGPTATECDIFGPHTLGRGEEGRAKAIRFAQKLGAKESSVAGVLGFDS